MEQSLEWYYLDSRGQEFGPFGAEQMRRWCDGGMFEAAGDKLLVRLPQWSTHYRLSQIYGQDKRAYFVQWPSMPTQGSSPSGRSRSPRRQPRAAHDDRGSEQLGIHHRPDAQHGHNVHAHPHNVQQTHGHYPPPPNGYGQPPPSSYAHPPPPHAGYRPLPGGYGHPYGAPPPPHGYGAPPPPGYGAPPLHMNGYPPPPGPPPHGYGAPPPHGYGAPLGYSHYPPHPAPPPSAENGSSKRPGPGAKHENMELNRKLIKFSEMVNKGQKTCLDFLGEIDGSIDRMNEVNLSTAFHRIAKIAKPQSRDEILRDPRFNRLQVRVGRALWHQLALLGTRDGKQVPMSIACVCWAHATLRLTDSELFAEVARRSAPYMRDFKNLEAANLLWAFAKLGESGSLVNDLFHSAASDVLNRPNEFSIVNLSTLAWAFATARIKNTGFFKGIARRIEENADRAESQEIANTLWAFATAGAIHQSLFCQMGKQASTKLESFKAQEAANSAWAFGRAGLVHVEFFDALAEHLRSRVSSMHRGLADFQPQHLAMIIGACSQLHAAEDAEDEDANEELADFNVEEVEDKQIDEDQDEDGCTAIVGGTRGSSEGQSVAWDLAALVLPECALKVKHFKIEEAAKVLFACKRLGLRRPDVSNLQHAQQKAAAAAKEFVDIVTDQLPAALSFKRKQRAER